MEIDGVFSGGGIKGFAMIGAYETIEAQGLQFRRLAGTSAGSIIAAFIAAGYTSSEINELMVDLNMRDFLDERRQLLPFRFMKWLLLYWRLGLYKGDLLEEWLKDKLAKKGVITFADLRPEALRVVVSDLTSGKMVVIPDDLYQYEIDEATFPVAKAIRASCSIPYFFEPVKLPSKTGQNIIVDGGVLSNFPMWLFAKDEKRLRPVLGIKLASKVEQFEREDISSAIQLFSALFETMRTAHDSRYIASEHVKNIIFIPTNDTLATEFNISESKRKQLIETGKNAAASFLKTWSY